MSRRHMEQWRFSSPHSYLRHYMESSLQGHAPTALLQEKSSRYPGCAPAPAAHFERNLLTLQAIEPRPAGSPRGSPVSHFSDCAIPPTHVCGCKGESAVKNSPRTHVTKLPVQTAVGARTRFRLPSRHKSAEFLPYVERNRTFSDNALWAVTSHSTRLSGVTSSKTLMCIGTAVLACNVSDLWRFLLHS